MGAKIDLVLAYRAAQRDGVEFNLAYVHAGFDQQAHGLFDPKYMNALYNAGFAAAEGGTAFEHSLPFRRQVRGSDAKGTEGPAERH